MADLRPPPAPDIIEQIPDPDTVRSWLADSLRRSELLRSLLRVALRKAGFERPATPRDEEVPVGR